MVCNHAYGDTNVSVMLDDYKKLGEEATASKWMLIFQEQIGERAYNSYAKFKGKHPQAVNPLLRALIRTNKN